MKNIFMTVLIVLVLVLGGYIVYDKVISNNEEEKTVEKEENKEVEKEEVTYSYKEIAGAYHGSVAVEIEDWPEAKIGYTLYLWENGTFSYRWAMNAHGTIHGNYIIEDNKIVLNYLYETNTGTGIFPIEGDGVLEIINKDTIVDNDDLHGKDVTEKIEMKRTTDSYISNDQENYNVNTLLKNAENIKG